MYIDPDGLAPIWFHYQHKNKDLEKVVILEPTEYVNALQGLPFSYKKEIKTFWGFRIFSDLIQHSPLKGSSERSRLDYLNKYFGSEVFGNDFEEPFVFDPRMMIVSDETPLRVRKALARELIRQARINGMDTAANTFQTFLDGSAPFGSEDGKKMRIVNYDSEWLREFYRVSEAEERNRKRFMGQVFEASEGLKVGESVEFSDYWYAQISYNGRGFSTEELFWFSGNSYIKSDGDFRVSRTPDKIVIQGSINNTWKDRYDWHPGLSVVLPLDGRIIKVYDTTWYWMPGAKPFEMRSFWNEDINREIQLR
jgi:hypothetical protein